MRNLDLKNVYVDNNGNPLHGRITFYKFHTTEKAPIYADKDGAALNNPCYTNVLGQTEVQVFLDDVDYTVKFEKYIGQGNMNSDMSASSWVEVRTVDTLAVEIPGYNTGNTMVCMTTQVSENLYTLDPEAVPAMNENGDRIVMVYGRFTPGDMLPAFYKHVEMENPQSDGGSIFARDSLNAWVLITPQILDVRIFGVFPSEDYLQMDGDYSNFRNAFDYANSKGIDVYLPQVYASGGYYLFTGGAYLLNTKLHLDNLTMISGKTGTIDSVLMVKEIVYNGNGPIFTNLAGTGKVILSTDTIYVGWLNPYIGSLVTGNPKRVIIDKPYGADQPIEIQNAEIYILNDIAHGDYTFTYCKFDETSRGRFSGCNLSFTGCENLSDKIINYDPGATACNVSYIDATTPLVCSKFTSADKYIEWMNIKGDAAYGDLGEQTIHATVLPGALIENAAGSITVSTATQAIEIHNFSGTINNLTSAVSINAVDCYLGLVGTGLGSIQLQRGAITAGTTNQLQIIGDVKLTDVEINRYLIFNSESPQVFKNCTIDKAITVNGTASFTDCKINDVVYTVDSPDADASILLKYANTFYHNIFGTDGKVYLTSTQQVTVPVVMTKWIGNISDHDFIDDSFWAAPTFDSRKIIQYEYKDNHGGCPELEFHLAEMVAARAYAQIESAVNMNSRSGIEDMRDALHGLGYQLNAALLRKAGGDQTKTMLTYRRGSKIEYAPLFRLAHLEPYAMFSVNIECTLNYLSGVLAVHNSAMSTALRTEVSAALLDFFTDHVPFGDADPQKAGCYSPVWYEDNLILVTSDLPAAMARAVYINSPMTGYMTLTVKKV